MKNDQVLRTQSGERVYDAEGIYVLCRLDELQVMLDTHALRRLEYTVAIPRNANERHVKETGHRLKFGCCKGRNLGIES